MVFSHLAIEDLCIVSQVCKIFNESSSSNKIWVNDEISLKFTQKKEPFGDPNWAPTDSWKRSYLTWLRPQVQFHKSRLRFREPLPIKIS